MSEVHRLEQILRDVMTFSRDVKTCFEKMPVTDMVKDCVLNFFALCEEHGITIDARYGTSLPVLVDRGQAAQATKNLISNGIDVMTNGGSLLGTTSLERLYDAPFVAAYIGYRAWHPSGAATSHFRAVSYDQGNRPWHRARAFDQQEDHRRARGFIKAENRKAGGLRARGYTSLIKARRTSPKCPTGNSWGAGGI